MKSAGIVVLYNPQIENIRNIKEYVNKVNIMIILDNSDVDNFDIIKQYIYIDNVRTIYIHFKKNIGLCSALNKGFEIANKNKCEWVLIMDDDSSFNNNIVEVYEKYLNMNDSEDIAVLSPVHLYDRSNNCMYDGVKSIKWAMTSGCFYNLKIFNLLKGFYEPLFVECLDLDYCYRALENNYKVYECGNAGLNHQPAETKEFKIFGKKIFKYGYASPWRYFMQARSLIWLILRYHHFGDLVKLLWKYFKVIFFFDNKKLFLSEMHKGIKEGLEIYISYKKNGERRK